MTASGEAGASSLTDLAPAKVNLTLRILGRRPDGYHLLESLVVFADTGDGLACAPAQDFSLTVAGDTADEAGNVSDNLVLKAARALQDQCGKLAAASFHLDKRLPVAAGLGGGSSDAAAALRLLARMNDIAHDDPRLTSAARATGADVPVCLDPRPRIMRGIGEVLSAPLALPQLPAVLVNPRVAVPTGQVFAARSDNSVMREMAPAGPDAATALVEAGAVRDAGTLIDAIAQSANDLEAPALALFPPVSDVLTALRSLPDCLFARMSGSGGTCFGLFGSGADAQIAASHLRNDYPNWWVAPTTLGSAPKS